MGTAPATCAAIHCATRRSEIGPAPVPVVEGFNAWCELKTKVSMVQEGGEHLPKEPPYGSRHLRDLVVRGGRRLLQGPPACRGVAPRPPPVPLPERGHHAGPVRPVGPLPLRAGVPPHAARTPADRLSHPAGSKPV